MAVRDHAGAAGAKASPSPGWFAVRALPNSVHVIAEPGHVNSYLVEGTESAMLVDTGTGIAHIRAVADSVCDKPIQVVNSHYHFDHRGGNDAFDDIAIHQAGVTRLGLPVPERVTRNYMTYTESLMRDWRTYEELDDRLFHNLTSEQRIRSLPEDFAADQYEIGPSLASRALGDNDLIDLGQRQIRVVHTPGHTPDSICLFDEKYGALFCGDTVSTGPINAYGADSDLDSFAGSTRRLAEMASDVSEVYVAHYLRYRNPPGLLTAVAAAFAQVAAGEARLSDSRDYQSRPVREAFFDGFSIQLPAAPPSASSAAST